MAINCTVGCASDSFFLERRMLKSTLDKAGEECRAAMAELVRVEQQAAMNRESAKLAFQKFTEAFDLMHDALSDLAQTYKQAALDGNADNRNDEMVRVVVEGCTEFIISQFKWTELLIGLSEKHEDEDDRQFYLRLAHSVRERGKQIAEQSLEVQRIWPWADPVAIEDSWDQYRNGELMDYETFKNGLQRDQQ